MERAETALMQAQIDRLFQVGELIRNELDNNRDAWRSQADRCASWSADLRQRRAQPRRREPRSRAFFVSRARPSAAIHLFIAAPASRCRRHAAATFPVTGWRAGR